MTTDTKPATEAVDMKLEVLLLGVSDVDRAKAFYEKLGFSSKEQTGMVWVKTRNTPQE